MPELPEVEITRRGLARHMEGAVLDKVITRRQTLRYPLGANFVTTLQGRSIKKISRRGKYLLIALSQDWGLIAHLGMSGRFQIQPPAEVHHTQPETWFATKQYAKHDHVIFHLNTGATIIYNDPRRFGFMVLAPPGTLAANPHLAKLGREPLDDGINRLWLKKRLRASKRPIKTALLDQSLIAGLGNIYVCEILWRAAISPNRACQGLSVPEIDRLIVAMGEVIAEAIAAGGSTLQDFRHVNGELGYFQHRFDVYGRAGEPCTMKGCNGIIQSQVQAGRTTFYCPKHQR